MRIPFTSRQAAGHIASSPFDGDLSTAPRRLLVRVIAALDIARERRQLMSLDDRMLKDIGLSRTTAEGEATRSLFDLPIRRENGWY